MASFSTRQHPLCNCSYVTLSHADVTHLFCNIFVFYKVQGSELVVSESDPRKRVWEIDWGRSVPCARSAGVHFQFTDPRPETGEGGWGVSN